MKLACIPLLLLLGFSCKKVEQPAYIRIDTIALKNSWQGENSLSSDVRDAWVYVDDQLQGAFELPCRIPVSQTGNHNIKVGAGIWVNSLATLRSPYVFYEFASSDFELTEGQETILNPLVSYRNNIHFAYQAGFESATGNTLEPTTKSDTIGSITNNPLLVCEGQGSFQVKLARDEGFIEFQQTESMALPKAGAYVYLELNYLSSHPLAIGVRSNYPAAGLVYTPVTSLAPSATWQKAYINLTRAVSTEVNAEGQKAVFSITKLAGSAPLDLRLDNLRIVHFTE